MKKIKFPDEFTTKRLILKKHKVSGASAMFSALDSDRRRLGAFLSFVSVTKKLSDQKKYITGAIAKWRRAELFDFGIYERSTGRYMGNIGVHTINWPHECCELGYWIHGDFEGQGFVTEAVTALTARCHKLGFHRVEIRCDPDNTRSSAVAERCGFDYEGRLKENLVIAGKYRDTLIFASVKSRRSAR